MLIPWRKRLRWAAQRLVGGPAGVVLLYHRVAQEPSDPWGLCVSPGYFAQHMEVLRRHFVPVSLQHMRQHLVAQSLSHGMVAVTFDDGYADNLHQAKPLLERYEVPATVFLITGAMGRQQEFWWDDLDRIISQPGILPELLQLTIHGTAHHWDLGHVVQARDEEQWPFANWRTHRPAPTTRQALYSALWSLLYRLPHSEQQEVLQALREWAGVTEVSRPTYRSLTPEDVVALAQDTLVEIGAHTVTHPVLSAHSVAVQRDEILQSKARCEAIIGSQVTSFAYPFGDHDIQTISLVQASGFTCACSTIDDVVRRRSDLFRLPRLEVQDCNGETFYRWLSRIIRHRT